MKQENIGFTLYRASNTAFYHHLMVVESQKRKFNLNVQLYIFYRCIKTVY